MLGFWKLFCILIYHNIIKISNEVEKSPGRDVRGGLSLEVSIWLSSGCRLGRRGGLHLFRLFLSVSRLAHVGIVRDVAKRQQRDCKICDEWRVENVEHGDQHADYKHSPRQCNRIRWIQESHGKTPSSCLLWIVRWADALANLQCTPIKTSVNTLKNSAKRGDFASGKNFPLWGKNGPLV